MIFLNKIKNMKKITAFDVVRFLVATLALAWVILIARRYDQPNIIKEATWMMFGENVLIALPIITCAVLLFKKIFKANFN